MNESVNARIAGCKLTTPTRITLFFSLTYKVSPIYNKQLNNLDRSVVTGKSQTSAYCNTARPQLVTSSNDHTLCYQEVKTDQ